MCIFVLEVKMLIKDVLACSLPAWYPLFEKVTIATKILPLPDDVLEYFLEDGKFVLPKGINFFFSE